jgi:hypothetical protein
MILYTFLRKSTVNVISHLLKSYFIGQIYYTLLYPFLRRFYKTKEKDKKTKKTERLRRQKDIKDKMTKKTERQRRQEDRKTEKTERQRRQKDREDKEDRKTNKTERQRRQKD